jgi:hypothetical protein
MNQTQDLFSLLFSTSSTLTQLRRRANLVKSFYGKYIYENPKPHPQDFFTNPLDWQWFLTYQNPLYQSLSSHSAKKDLVDIDSKIKALTPITCFTAIQIPEDGLDRLTFRFRNEFGPGTILETRVDPNIIGGCVLIKRGIVQDYSLRKKINSIKPQILHQLQEVIVR